jgi:hypothetical protein
LIWYTSPGFADAASLNAVSRHTANEALEEYLRSAELSGGPNISRAGILAAKKDFKN